VVEALIKKKGGGTGRSFLGSIVSGKPKETSGSFIGGDSPTE
jgi:hypothetical protein